MARKTISQDQLDGFSIDDETNQLFWRDHRVMTVVSLPWWVQVSALVASFGTAAGGLAAAISLFHYWH